MSWDDLRVHNVTCFSHKAARKQVTVLVCVATMRGQAEVGSSH